MMLRFCFYFIVLLVLFTACQQNSNSQPTQPTNPTLPKPDNIPNAITKIYADSGLKGSLTQQNTTNLLQNGDFESLEGWTACNGATNALVLSDDAHGGSKAGFLQQADSCFFQSVSVSVGQTVSLSCYANLVEDNSWTGLGFAFSDVNWQAIENAPENAVRGNVYRQYVTSSTAPANTTYASMWVYTGGKVLVDDCRLIIGPPIIPEGNLLLNPSFEDGQNGWFSCGDASKITLSPYAATGNQSIEVKDGGCLYQDLRVLPDFDYELTCQASQGPNTANHGYASLILSFLDASWNSIDNKYIPVSVDTFRSFKLALKAPANTKHAAVTFYSEATTRYDDCSLVYSEPPATPPNVSLAADINPNSGHSFPTELIVFNNKLYFKANDGTSGEELWEYDGISNPTLVKDIYPGPTRSLPKYFTVFNNKLYFVADDGTNGKAVWEYDGISQPQIVTNIAHGVNHPPPSDLMVFNNKLHFLAYTDIHGYELWEYDGNNSSLVKDINPDGNSSMISFYGIVFNNKLYFSANDGVHGRELWEYDGNNDPNLAEDIISGAGSSSPDDFAVFNGKLYFSANDGTHGFELWEYDGINDPSLVKDINSGPNSSQLMDLTVFNNKLYFQANDGVSGRELWEYDGNNTPQLVKNINPNPHNSITSGHSYPSSFTIFNSKLYFRATGGVYGIELWEYDGNNDPSLVKDIDPGSDSSYPAYLTVFNNKLYFGANDGISGNELWVLVP